MPVVRGQDIEGRGSLGSALGLDVLYVQIVTITRGRPVKKTARVRRAEEALDLAVTGDTDWAALRRAKKRLLRAWQAAVATRGKA